MDEGVELAAVCTNLPARLLRDSTLHAELRR